MAVKMTEEFWLTCLSHTLTTETEEFMGLLFGDIQVGRIQVIAFQSLDGKRRNVSPLVSSTVVEVESSWSSLKRSPSESTCIDNIEDTCDSRMVKAKKEEGLPTSLGAVEPSQGAENSTAAATVLFFVLLLETAATAAVGSCRPRCLAFVTPISICCHDCCLLLQPLLLYFLQVGGRSSGLEFFSHDINYLEKQRKKENSLVPYNADNLTTNNGLDVDSMDMTACMQEALHRSNMDMSSGAEYVRKEVPLQVLPSKSLLKPDFPKSSFVDMQHVLFEEERSACNQAISQNMCLTPGINTLQAQLKENEIQLTEAAKSLEPEALGSRDHVVNMNSHRHLLSHARSGSPSMELSGAWSPGGGSGTCSRRKAP